MKANFSYILQALLAALFFGASAPLSKLLLAEAPPVSPLALAGIFAIILASILLSTNFADGFGFSLGALGVLLACVLWGVDNNFTRNISAKDPLTIVAWKGLVTGTFSLFLGLLLGQPLPALVTVRGILLLGFVSYGLSTMFFIFSLRGLSALRTSALCGTALLAGVIFSFTIFRRECKTSSIKYRVTNIENRSSNKETNICLQTTQALICRLATNARRPGTVRM